MNTIIKKFARVVPDRVREELSRMYWNWKNSRLKAEKEKKALKEWIAKGKPAPPPHSIKRDIVRHYARLSGAKILVETGTYLGEMVEAQLRNFECIHSVELSEELHERAKKKFEGNSKVVLWRGDSGKVLADVLTHVDTKALFWLDGHYSAGITAKGDKECPILEEIDAIFDGVDLGHVLLIDDARCFTGEHDYPELQELKSYVQNKNPAYVMEVMDDVVRFTMAE